MVGPKNPTNLEFQLPYYLLMASKKDILKNLDPATQLPWQESRVKVSPFLLAWAVENGRMKNGTQKSDQ